jgi:polyisoprenoid-binding protein YceI
MPRMSFVEICRRAGVGVVAVLLLAMLSASAARRVPAMPEGASREIVLIVDPAQSKAHWTLGSTLHTVHGTFALKSGTIRLDQSTGKASGEIVVDATSGESGNDGRDKKMHKEIIESAKYNAISFRPDRVDGTVLSQGSASVQVHGTFSLHGGDHELTVPVQAELATDHWKGTAKFTVPYIAWGLKSPSNFLLKADPAVDVDLELAGTLKKNTSGQ